MSWQLFDRLQAFFRHANIYRNEAVFTDQTSLSKIISGGEFLDFSTQHALLQQTNLQINRLERYKDFDQMDEVDVNNLALDIYADEASLIDPERKHSILVRAKNQRVKEEVEDLLYTRLMMDHKCRPLIRYLCKYGDLPLEIIPDKARDGIAFIKHMNIYNFTRVETKFGDLVGFFYQDEVSRDPQFMHPWQVAHMRLSSLESIYYPYGRSILDGARKAFKQLRLMEDSALIYRITRAPEKRVFTIPVGNIATKDVPQYLELIARTFKKKKFFDPSTGDVNERWHPLIQEDDFWMPQRADGSGPTVTTLPGAENLDAIADIEYFKKKQVSALKIPFSRVGIGEPDEGNSEPLSKVAPEFAKAIQWVQREFIMGIKKVAITHLALKGFPAEDIREFDLSMTASSAIDELYRMEVWASRADVIDALKGTELFPDEWIIERFTDMTRDEIEEMLDSKKEEAGALPDLGGGEDLFGGAPPGLGGPAPGLPPLEGYNYELEKKVISELMERHPKAFLKLPKKQEKFFSGFDAMLAGNEFDNLNYVNGNGDQVIKSGVSRKDRKEVIAENKALLTGNLNHLDPSEDEITDGDLPER